MTTKCCVQVSGNTRMGSVRHRCCRKSSPPLAVPAPGETRHRTDSRVESARGGAAANSLHTRQDGHHGQPFSMQTERGSLLEQGIVLRWYGFQ